MSLDRVWRSAVSTTGSSRSSALVWNYLFVHRRHGDEANAHQPWPSLYATLRGFLGRNLKYYQVRNRERVISLLPLFLIDACSDFIDARFYRDRYGDLKRSSGRR